MKATLKKILGWDQRTEAQKKAFRGRLYHPLVALIALGLYLGSRLISLFPIPLWFKRNIARLYVKKAELDLRSGANSAAMQAARHAVALYPDVPGGYYILGDVTFPGETYVDLLRRFHEWLRPKSYIEIGVSRGNSFALANPPTVAVGIDPKPRLFNAPKTVCKIFPLTSDDYFATRDPRPDIEARTVDLAFIDGLHLFEQALRDFINIEKISSPTTLVLIHDCFPFDARTAEREPRTIFWLGDVWKIIPCLREFRPDLDVFTIATRPSGLGVVSRLNSRSTVLVERFNEIVSRYIGLEVDPDERRRKECAAMVANNWPEIVSRVRHADVAVKAS